MDGRGSSSRCKVAFIRLMLLFSADHLTLAGTNTREHGRLRTLRSHVCPSFNIGIYGQPRWAAKGGDGWETVDFLDYGEVKVLDGASQA